MERRTFLKFMLGAAAIPAAAQLEIEKEIEYLDSAALEPNRSFQKAVGIEDPNDWPRIPDGLYWREMVATKADLPDGDPDGAARLVESEDTVYTHCVDHGWFAMLSVEDIRAGEGLRWA